ncbi:MAG: type II toxin-antitoxin system VapC family toxin [Oscillochloris sp.]|nr:type II toxin-antitoxin system VapC family toxin [Oscillochloris sp.]
MYLLDTNHLSRLLDRDPQLTSRLAALGGVEVATCAIVRGELIFMAAKSERRTANMARVESLLSSLPVHPADAAAATWYGTFKDALIDRFGPKERAKRRRATLVSVGVSENDLWIAAIAKSRNLVIVSVDSDFTRIQEIADLQVESWLA